MTECAWRSGRNEGERYGCMRTIVKADIIDIVPYEKGFIYLQIEELLDRNIKVSFYAYDEEGNTIFPVTKKNYQQCKFGPRYQKIISELDDFVFCNVIHMPGQEKMVSYEDGQLQQFYANGALQAQRTLRYQESPIICLTAIEKHLWGVVPDVNAVVRYSLEEDRVMLRIGGATSNAFSEPVHVTQYQDRLYVCNKGKGSISSISLENYAVKEYVTFPEPALRYFRIGKREYVLLRSGIYLL